MASELHGAGQKIITILGIIFTTHIHVMVEMCKADKWDWRPDFLSKGWKLKPECENPQTVLKITVHVFVGL